MNKFTIPEKPGNAGVGFVDGGAVFFAGLRQSGKPALNVIYRDSDGEEHIIAMSFDDEGAFNHFLSAINTLMEAINDDATDEQKRGTLPDMYLLLEEIWPEQVQQVSN